MSAMAESEMIVELDALGQLYDGWDALARAAGLSQMTPAWILAWWRHLAPVGAAPRVVVVKDRAEIIGVAPFYIQEGQRARVDYRLPGIELAAGLAPLATPGREWEVAEAIAGALAEATPRPDLIALEGVPLASHWTVALRDRWPAPVRPVLRQYHIYACPTVSLREESFDAWFVGRSAKFRSSMRRLRRRFEEVGGSSRMSTTETLQGDIATLMRLHSARWEERRGESNLVAFGGSMSAMLEDVGRRLLEEGRFRLWIAEVAGEPIGADLYLAAGGEVLGVNGGWSESWKTLSPPLLATTRTIEDAFERGDRRLDLGMGDQSHKVRFADGNDPVGWSVLMVPSRRLPLTYARTFPTLARSRLRETARRGLPARRIDQLRALRSRLQRQ